MALSGGRDGDRGENTVGGHHQGGSSSPGGSSSSSSGSSSQLVTGPTLGSLYRSTRDEYGRYGNREQRCGSCGGGGGSGTGYADRDMRSYGRPLGVHGYYAGRGSIYDDRNWYYRPEGGYYDDRMSSRGGGDGYYSSMRPNYMGMMMGYDDRYMNRYDDRYYPMSTRGYYDNRPAYPTAGAGVDPYAMRGYPAAPAPAAGAYPGYRGNGYDNLDPQYDYYMMLAKGGGAGGAGGYGNRGGYYGTSGAYGGGYEDRNRVGYGYDHKNFRPWDETYRYNVD
ncbi:conserved hypothetical protein [Culex quinquefasciatus]|uniref:Uncharacterized protein n=1 Tax=Culex quinquefasciatus TaxID=7176 RepID=B0XIR9_CULQU|nr:conserved hypothetical protein [Culex quinquefasciatus]|eukprot:XP_001869541.1 conserved hypothetical protein [Culex quinquefasciatus]